MFFIPTGSVPMWKNFSLIRSAVDPDPQGFLQDPIP
jgi:hypothetical protein